MSDIRSVGVALIGMGYWGPKLAKSFVASPYARLHVVCGRTAEQLNTFRAQFPSLDVELTTDDERAFSRDDVQLVCIATQARTHFKLIERAILAGKDVLVEKPFTTHLAEAEKLVALAKQHGRRIFVDHIYLFSNEFRRFKAAAKPYLGEPRFVYQSSRCDYGLFVNDVGVLPHLFYHDLYILDELVGLKEMMSGQVQQSQVVSPWQKDYANIVLQGGPGKTFHVRTSMVSERKIREISLHTGQGILTWDDCKPAPEKFKFHRKRIAVTQQRAELMDEGTIDADSSAAELWPSPEALQNLITYTLQCLLSGARALHEGTAAIRVWRVLDTMQRCSTFGVEETDSWRA